MTSLAEDLRAMRALKEEAEAIGRRKKDADEAFKAKQGQVLTRMQVEEADSFRTNGFLFTRIDDRLKGQVEDRRKYVRWALENDEGIADFLDWLDTYVEDGLEGAARGKFWEAILGTSMVHYKEDGTVANSQAKAHVDDDQPLPPGLTFRPDPYIQQRAS